MKSRAAWGPEEYAATTGRSRETANILKMHVRAGMSMEDARDSMSRQGFNPELVGAPPDDQVILTIRNRVAAGGITIVQGREMAQSLGFNPDKISAAPTKKGGAK